jgi:drug/metabolite transporter (DMT)-like permease
MPKLSRSIEAMALMIVAMFLFACMGVAVRMLAGEMHTSFIVFLRNVMSLGIVLVWTLWLRGKRPNFRTTRMKSHFWRSAVGMVSMQLWFYSLTILPLTLATAISFSTPIFSTIFAILFLGERAGIRRWSAILAGFIGVMVTLHPDSSQMDPRVLIVIFSSALVGITSVLVKSLTRTEAPETIVFYMALFMIPWSLPPALLHWQEVSLQQLWVIFLVAFFSTAAHLMTTRAFKHTDMVVLVPFDFTRLIFIAGLAYVFFGETMDRYTLAGALIIIISTVYIAHREARKRREAILEEQAAAGL